MFTRACAAASRCSPPTPSSTPAPAGRASTSRARRGAVSEHEDRVALHAPHRGALRALRGPPRPRLPGRPADTTGLRYCINGAALEVQARRHLNAAHDIDRRVAANSGLRMRRPKSARCRCHEEVPMHGLNRPDRPPAAAHGASAGPCSRVHHGVELVDEYAWLRADNWQEVMRDPAVLDPEIRAYLEAENAYTEAALADTRDLQEALYAEMKARIKEDDSSVPAPDGAFEYFMSYVTGGQYPRLCRRPRGGGAGESCSTATRRPRASPTGSSAPPPTAPTTSCSPTPSTTRARSSSPSASATSRPARTCADAIPDTRSAIVWARDSRTLFYVRLDANQRPLFVYRHRVGTPGRGRTCWSTRRRTSASTSASARPSRARFIIIDAHDHQTTEVYLIDADRPEGAPRLVGAARARPRVRGRAPRRPADHHHQLGRRRGLPHLRGAAGDARRGQLARDHRPQARPPDPRDRRLQRPPRAARARGRPAAHRRPPLRRRRRARHRLRRGGLLARHVGRLRVRHHARCASPTRR